MRVTIFGAGYVGLVTGACLADVGNDVLCHDVDRARIELLAGGGMPIYEPGLKELVATNMRAGRLRFGSDPQEAVEHGMVQFIAVGTPQAEDGAADVSAVLSAARTIARHMPDYRVVVNKSTVPVGTRDAVAETIRSTLAARGAAADFSVVSNPEFLKEGAAISDFMRPDRIVIGADDERAAEVMRSLFAPFERNRAKLIFMSVGSAELTKYAANAMLAARISFMNELALFAERIGADIEQVRRGIGTDPRIGPQFLYAGIGYGGSCFPKDVRALIRNASDHGIDLGIVRAVEAANERQKRVLGEKIVGRLGEDLAGRRIAVWGLSFKPETDDMREAPSVPLILEMLTRGATVVAYDPVAQDEAKRVLGTHPRLAYATHANTAVRGADALVLVTEWKEFRSPDFAQLRTLLAQPLIFDGRNIFDARQVRAAGIEYHGVGVA